MTQRPKLLVTLRARRCCCCAFVTLLVGLYFYAPVSVLGQWSWSGRANDNNWFTGRNWNLLTPPPPYAVTDISHTPQANIDSPGLTATAFILNLGGGGTLNVSSGGSLAVGGAINIGLGGTLNMVGTGTLRSPSISLSGGTLSFIQTQSNYANVFNVPIFGSGTVNAFGSTGVVDSETILTGRNLYGGLTNITDGGILAIGGPFALGLSNVSVTNGGVLETTSLVIKGSPPLTINDGANYFENSKGILALGIAGTKFDQYDRVQAVGTASLGFGTLNLFGLGDAPFAPSNGDAFAVVIAGGGRFGRFGDINDTDFNRDGLQRITFYLHNAVVVLYVTPRVPPEPEPEPSPQPPGVPTEAPIKEPPPLTVDDGNMTLPLPVDPNDPIPESEVVQLVDPSAEQLTSIYEMGISGAQMQRYTLNDRMFQIQQGMTGFVSNIAPVSLPTKENEGKGEEGKKELPPAYQPTPENRWGIWISGYGNWVDVNSTDDALGYRFTNAAVAVGVDYLIIPGHLAIGAFGAYQHTRADLSPSGDLSASTGRGGVYATYYDRGWYVDAAAWGEGTSYSSARQGILGTAQGDSSGAGVSTYGETGYLCNIGRFSFGPLVSLQFTNISFDSFDEHGSLVPLDIHGNSQSSLALNLGGQAYAKFPLGKIVFIPQLRMAWGHEFNYSSLGITASAPEFDNASATFVGPNVGRNALIINAGCSFLINPRVSITIEYDGQLGRTNYTANGVDGVFSISF
jgi:outer membrane autotransporter protein